MKLFRSLQEVTKEMSEKGEKARILENNTVLAFTDSPEAQARLARGTDILASVKEGEQEVILFVA